MKNNFKIVSILFASICLASCNESVEHKHNYGYLIPEVEATCENGGTRAHYHCESCGKNFDEGKNELLDLVIPSLGHKYLLSSDEYTYKCRKCNKIMKSGKEEIKLEQKTRIFIGSSIANGYNAITKDHYSVADMMNKDYLKVELTIDGEDLVRYFVKKASVVDTNNDGFGGVYSSDDLEITINGNGYGSYKGQTFTYYLSNDVLTISNSVEEITAFKATFHGGDKIYKHTSDGFSLSDIQPRWASLDYEVTDRHSYVGLFEQAFEEHKDEKIDSVIIQLSTNDVGLFMDKNCTQHLPFGDVTGESVKESSAFDKTTSLGALEYLIAASKEAWGCDVTVFSCHMDTSSYSTWKSNDYDLSKVVVPYEELYEGCKRIVNKWGVKFIDFWSSREANDKLESNVSSYFSDSIHLQEKGYEAVYLPFFRENFKDDVSGSSSESYTYTFMVDGTIYKTMKVKGNCKSVALPVIPFKEGYEIKGWDIDSISYRDLTINALYEKK